MNLSPNEAPLFDRLADYQARRLASFHVPGHKSGQGLDRTAGDWFRQVMSIDFTEISGLDDLYQAEGVIAEAQRLAADCFGAEETLFLVGGSTVGNLAMILAACGRDELLLVQRNVHKSVLHGLMLAGARAVFLPPCWDEASGQAAGVRLEDVREALMRYPEAKGLLVVNPNYYGMGIGLKPLADMLHACGKPLLVDEAHGAHFGFHPELPSSALAAGADVVVQSTHKMLTAMTMGAMLHVQGDRVNRALLKQRVAMLQSSSPSYPVMASLDLARRMMHVNGPAAFTEGLAAVRWFRERLQQTADRFEAVEPTPRTQADITKDPFKVIVRDRTGALSGYELQHELESRGCMIELADPRQVLLVFSLASTMQDARKLIEAFQDIASQGRTKKQELAPPATNIYVLSSYRQMSLPVSFDLRVPGLDDAAGGTGTGKEETKIVAISEAAGALAAETVIPYPPGIPLLFPGEPITLETVQCLEQLIAAGARFHGVRNVAAERTIRIYSTN